MLPREVIHSFISAVEKRDVEAAAICFDEDAPYRNMPHPPVYGPAGVRIMLSDILAISTEVRWDVITEAYTHNRGHLERIDRFVIGGIEYSVACHAVIEVDETRGLITSFRDYVDLTPWRHDIALAIEKITAQ